VCSSDLIWPAPEAAALMIEGGVLDLPVRASVPGGEPGDEWSFEPPEADTPWQVDELRAPENIRRVEEDLISGVVALIIEDDFGKVRDRGHGLVSGGKSRERWEIHPDAPQRARAITHWTEEMERGDIRLRTETYAQMHADGENFYLSGRLEAYENDVMIYERDITDTVARDQL
jgi:hypothetical protein